MKGGAGANFLMTGKILTEGDRGSKNWAKAFISCIGGPEGRYFPYIQSFLPLIFLFPITPYPCETYAFF